ncbi:TnsA endonuclease N-terminal domain-containing protein [Undibacterium flavidum]|uniref:TnsA endonuclease N-terminal domain-containing protein n=1 Tax=Undibacterium flavidum TaxID=2762297 RepID=A0ABR6YA50_9BURK|nr:TnsA endonuclease N-terminal domain-containing protein [Undibacterium flavidum]MBC3873505.1 TnsA endonuclease N-terminal domain-containing protein [Undibacterium flavidum]
MPVRKIPISNRAVTGLHAGTGARYESSLERDFFECMMMEPDFDRLEAQPVKIQYLTTDNKLRRYTPDALVHFKSLKAGLPPRRPILCEVKYREELENDFDKFRERFFVARRFARERGWIFKVVTERRIRTTRFANLKFLFRYKKRLVSQSDRELLLELIATDKMVTPKILINSVSENSIRQAELISCLWNLVANGLITVDLLSPLTMNSQISLSK